MLPNFKSLLSSFYVLQLGVNKAARSHALTNHRNQEEQQNNRLNFEQFWNLPEIRVVSRRAKGESSTFYHDEQTGSCEAAIASWTMCVLPTSMKRTLPQVVADKSAQLHRRRIDALDGGPALGKRILADAYIRKEHWQRHSYSALSVRDLCWWVVDNGAILISSNHRRFHFPLRCGRGRRQQADLRMIDCCIFVAFNRIFCRVI